MFNPIRFVKDVLSSGRGQIGEALEYSIEVLSQEDVSYKYKTPNKPVEAGYEISDHTTKQPTVLNITIVCNEWNSLEQQQTLQNMADARRPVCYYSPINYQYYDNMIIENLSFKARKEQKNGFTATMQLKQIKIVIAQDATYTTMADSSGSIPQSSGANVGSGNGTLSESPIKTDNTSGTKKCWSSDSLVYRFFN